METVLNFFINKTWKSEYFKSWVLAQARGIGATLGGILVAHGLADKGIAETVSGLVVAFAMYYLQHLDVKIVDGKIKVALLTTVETIPVEKKDLPEIKK